MIVADRRAVRLGLVGYGTGGRHFHAPFVRAAEGIDLAGFVTRSEQRRAPLAHEWPGVPSFSSLAELLASGVDAVTITTPPATRRELVLEAVAAGVPSAQGRDHDFYTQFAAAVRGAGPQPVPASEGIATLAVLDAARASAESGSTVALPGAVEP